MNEFDNVKEEKKAVVKFNLLLKQNEEKIFEQILEFIQKQENLDGYGIHLVNTNQRVMVLFGESEENLYQAYDKILRIGRVHCDEFVVAVSWAHRSLLNGSLAYLEATQPMTADS